MGDLGLFKLLTGVLRSHFNKLFLFAPPRHGQLYLVAALLGQP